MLNERASIQVARLSVHRIKLVGELALGLENVLMVISCDGEDDSAGEVIRLRPR
jgi:hypothetical protein